MASHLNYYKYHVRIFDYDENEVVFSKYFDDIVEDNDFIVIDKINLGEEIGVRIISQVNTKEIIEKINRDSKSNGDIIEEIWEFTNEFKDEVLTLVEEEITNGLRDEICECVLEYMCNNF